MFTACSRQWQKFIPPMGGKVIFEGLRYSDVAAVISMMGFNTRAPEIFRDVQIMESEAMEILNSG